MSPQSEALYIHVAQPILTVSVKVKIKVCSRTKLKDIPVHLMCFSCFPDEQLVQHIIHTVNLYFCYASLLTLVKHTKTSFINHYFFLFLLTLIQHSLLLTAGHLWEIFIFKEIFPCFSDGIYINGYLLVTHCESIVYCVW